MNVYYLLISMFIMMETLNGLDDLEDLELEDSELDALDNYLDDLEDEFLGIHIFKPFLSGLHHAFKNPNIINKHKERGRKFKKPSKGDKEFLVFFDLKCAKKKQKTVQELEQEFEAKYPCYELKERTNSNPDLNDPDEDEPEDDYIILDHNPECTTDNNVKINFDEFCISEIDENEETVVESNQCVSKTVTTALWNLNSVCPKVTSGFQFIEYEKTFDPGFDIFVIDTGIDKTHTEFTGITIDRIYDAYKTSATIHSHGTHVAGTIFSPKYGAFKMNSKVKVFDVRVLGTDGKGKVSEMIDGMDEIIKILKKNKKAKKKRKAIINMSVGAGFTRQISKKIRKMKKYGGITVVAAGNENCDAKLRSPGASRSAITVGNLERSNKRRASSNYGPRVDIWAPGTNIMSTIPGGGSGTKTGTSMASPLVAAIAANILANNPRYGFHKIRRRMLKYAKKDADDLRGKKKLPRVQIECDEYCTKTSKCVEKKTVTKKTKTPAKKTKETKETRSLKTKMSKKKMNRKVKKRSRKKRRNNAMSYIYNEHDIDNENGFVGDYNGLLTMEIPFMVIGLCVFVIMACICFVIGGSIGFKMNKVFMNKTTEYQPISIEQV